jgi:hypothetical protein
MNDNATLKLYVNQRLVSQRKANSKSTINEIIERWKRMYALDKHNYKIYIQVPSKMNPK